jgi:hypothetical protein
MGMRVDLVCSRCGYRAHVAGGPDAFCCECCFCSNRFGPISIGETSVAHKPCKSDTDGADHANRIQILRLVSFDRILRSAEGPVWQGMRCVIPIRHG